MKFIFPTQILGAKARQDIPDEKEIAAIV